LSLLYDPAVLEHSSPSDAALRLAARCEESGFPLTVQRRAIYEALLARMDHPTADGVYEDVRRRMPEIGRTTVYRTLDRLVSLGLAARVHRLGLAARFDANVARHDHAVCVRCGAMEDLDRATESPDPRTGPLVDRGFEVLESSVQVHVVCPACRAESNPVPRANP
jgi:Fur family peroxide stress response transcriptional regulator